MKRGEVHWGNFDPTVGSEIKKTRPCLIISNNINDPTGKFKDINDVHGNWCGYNARSGSPVDDLDRFCQKHDSACVGGFGSERFSDWNFFNSDIGNIMNKINTNINLISEGLKYSSHNPGEGLIVAIGGVLFIAIQIPLIILGNLLRLLGL